VIQRSSRILPFTCEQVFDLAADIERYPEFLRWWISSTIRSRTSNTLIVEQVVGVGPIQLRFASTAVLHRPQRIDVTSHDPPFRAYSLIWLISANPTGGCRMGVTADLELRSGLLQHFVGRFLPDSIDDIIAAFEARANAIYGGVR
jgi:coenzyme Q-binding protein COQ10